MVAMAPPLRFQLGNTFTAILFVVSLRMYCSGYATFYACFQKIVVLCQAVLMLHVAVNINFSVASSTIRIPKVSAP